MRQRHIIMVLLMVFAIAAQAQDRVVGALVWPKEQAGLYDVDVESGKVTRRVIDSEMFGLVPGGAFGQAAVRRDNLYYATNYFTQDRQICVYHAVYDLNTNQRVWIKRNGLIAAAPMDMAYCEQDGKTYGCFHCPEGLGEAYVFGTLNLETFEVTRIKLLTQKWLAMACAPDGTLYVINDAGTLLSVNKENGNTSPVGQTSAPVYFESSACISADGDAMYLSVIDMEGAMHLMTIDLATGETVNDVTLAAGEEVLGMVVLEEEDDEAPAAATGFDVPVSPNNTATASWTMPDGEGTMAAMIQMDGEDYFYGEYEPLESVTTTINAGLTGYHTFTLRVSYDDHASLPVSVRRWIGPDTPCAPQNVSFSRTGNTNSLTWTPVTAGVNEGYIDLSRMTYTIYRYPGGQIVAGGLTEPSWSEEMDEPSALTTIYYEVQAVIGGSGERSLRGESNHISFAAIQPPYSQAFDSEASLEPFTIIDGNKDGSSWTWYEYGRKARIFGSDYTALDDWLITPPVMLEAGKYYEFSLDLHGFKRAYTEYFEICCGRGNSAATMTTTLLPETQLSADNNTRFTVGYIAPETGNYFFGLHATSPAGTQYIYTDNWYISEGKTPSMPAQATNLTLTRAPKGRLAVDVAFTLPTTTAGGDPLTAITRCTVVRDGYDTIKELSDVAPGQRIEFTDTPGLTTFHRYSVYVYNEAGVSAPAEAMEYVGPYSPAQPTDFRVRRTHKDGEVVMTWNVPETDKFGNELDPDLITYTVAAIVDGAPKYIIQKENVTSLTYQEQSAGEPQRFVTYAVYAETEGGSSTKLESEPCPVGAPYTTPFVESFAGGDSRTVWYPEDLWGVSVWDYAKDETLGDITSCDGDNGFIYAQGLQKNNTTTLNSGLITIDDPDAALELHYWSYGNDQAVTTVKVRTLTEDSGVFTFSDYTTLATINHQSGEEGWQTVTLPLGDFAGHDIQIQLLARFGTQCTVAYDNIRIIADITYNLSLAEYNIPDEVQAGSRFAVTATVQNNGKEDVAGADYATVLMLDGKEVARKRGFGTLRAGKSVNVSFTQAFSVLDDGEHTYEIIVEYDDDDMTADNTSGAVTVLCIVPDFPVPANVKATTYGDGNVMLTWNTPEEPEDMPVVTEDFESYPAWAKSDLGSWTLIDGDKAPVGSVPLTIPGVTSGSTFMSYVVINNSEDSKLNVHSGNQALLTIWVKNAQNDDWLISPPLSGHAQTISLWARSGSPSYPESFQLMATDKYSTAIADYSEVGYVDRVSKDWTEYTFDLPEGTTHFAVRCISMDRYYFTIDDISYVSDLHSTFDLQGYNIYRDGVKTNSSPIETLSLTETSDGHDADYRVSAVYRKGESRAVPFGAIADGIDKPKSESMQSETMPIYDLSGRRLLRTVRGVNIVDGKKVVR